MINVDGCIIFTEKNEDFVAQNKIVLFDDCIAHTNVLIGKL